MPIVRARTNSAGRPNPGFSGSIDIGFYREPYNNETSPWISTTPTELRVIRKEPALSNLLRFLKKRGLKEYQRIYYYHFRATHYIKFKGRIYSCHLGEIKCQK